MATWAIILLLIMLVGGVSFTALLQGALKLVGLCILLCGVFLLFAQLPAAYRWWAVLAVFGPIVVWVTWTTVRDTWREHVQTKRQIEVHRAELRRMGIGAAMIEESVRDLRARSAARVKVLWTGHP